MNYEKYRWLKWDFQNIAYGKDERQTLDIAIPPQKDAHAIVYIHGGAYMMGDKSYYPSFLEGYAQNNVVASINYRLVSADGNIGMKNILADVDHALRKAIGFSNSHGVNIKGIILVGHSAGGHLGLLYGYRFKKIGKHRIAACISLAGPTDFTDDIGWSSMSMWGKTIEERLSFISWLGSRLTGTKIKLEQHNWTKQKTYPAFVKRLLAMSPLVYVFGKGPIPPTLLVHAPSDNQVPYSNATRLKNALDRMSIPHALITTTGKEDNHMLGGEEGVRRWYCEDRVWVTETKKWLEGYLDGGV